jgi:hypothetical protein
VYPVTKKMGKDPSVDVGHKYESSVHGKIASSPGYKEGLGLSRSTVTRSPKLNKPTLLFTALL